ncbi:MBL fold metallo-hydrolase [Prauserella sp. PE36]|uniref:MBL fold metallo-hydrolase n=1 Tax=Prauserella endophytica TaxID=1592324 RepID=A0ABY2S7D1_9PSEU|nr:MULTISPECIES: MBL fold metallo-hydrolase [Prauserella]PXY21822.1 MBL fold metallo-hydrolase [Prauserella coralliicola]RBM15219.1 MBL fold metallo-hydrolase [Prauserella sp. PE36]TKG71613.1 MBL fold metallo-hydrolase [Prauserella endophytica]
MFPREDSLTFIGTATTLVRLGPFTVLTDPNFLHRGQWCYFGQGLFSRRRTEPSAGIAELPPLDAVVLSHLHGDHFDRVARRGLAPDLPILTTGHAARRLRRHGFREPVPLATWSAETLRQRGATLTVTAVPARHSTGVLGKVLPPVMGTVWDYVAAPDSRRLRIYVSGDTVVHDELREIRERLPGIDLAVLHLGGTRVLGMLVTMDDRQGGELLELLDPAHAVPVHFDDYRNFTSPISNFLDEAARRHPGTSVRLLRRGESLPLTGLARSLAPE